MCIWMCLVVPLVVGEEIGCIGDWSVRLGFVSFILVEVDGLWEWQGWVGSYAAAVDCVLVMSKGM